MVSDQQKSTQIAVVGGGPGGYAAAFLAADLGLSVALVDMQSNPGGVCLYTPGLLVAGDTLFAGSIGRTDLPGGSYSTLIRSVQDRLLPLPDATRVLSGHGPETTIGSERRANPFILQPEAYGSIG